MYEKQSTSWQNKKRNKNGQLSKDKTNRGKKKNNQNRQKKQKKQSCDNCASRASVHIRYQNGENLRSVAWLLVSGILVLESAEFSYATVSTVYTALCKDTKTIQ